MRRKYVSSFWLTALAFLSSFCTNDRAIVTRMENRNEVKDSTGFAVVELFTSEGCSSCPAADRAVEELAKKFPDQVYVLSFHVDYWNRLGWVDSFSQAAYTQRQSSYAAQFNLNSIYTPQVVVNGHQEFVGSDESRLQSVTQKELNRSAGGVIRIKAEIKSSKIISINYKAKIGSNQKLNIALVQNEATSDVRQGENSGRKLHHINIVRDYKTVSSDEGTVELRLPTALSINDTKIIVYQQKTRGAVTAVSKVNLMNLCESGVKS